MIRRARTVWLVAGLGVLSLAVAGSCAKADNSLSTASGPIYFVDLQFPAPFPSQKFSWNIALDSPAAWTVPAAGLNVAAYGGGAFGPLNYFQVLPQNIQFSPASGATTLDLTVGLQSSATTANGTAQLPGGYTVLVYVNHGSTAQVIKDGPFMLKLQ